MALGDPESQCANDLICDGNPNMLTTVLLPDYVVHVKGALNIDNFRGYKQAGKWRWV